MPGISGNTLPQSPAANNGMDDIAAALAAQIAACNEAATRCFAMGQDSDKYGLDHRFDALRIATRLIQATASAAAAIKRIKGSEFHQHVTISRPGAA